MTFGTPQGTGWIEVICGCMFSGKTEELIHRLRRAQIARKRVAIFKPLLDDRYASGEIVTHDRISIPSARPNRSRWGAAASRNGPASAW